MIGERTAPDRVAVVPLAVREGDRPGWRRPWWKAVLSLLLWLLGAALILGGLAAGLPSASLHGLELAIIGLLVADAWGWRSATPLIRSGRRRRAAIGWLLVVALAIGLPLLLPVQ